LVLNLIRQAIHAGLQVVNVTQCSAGSVNMGQYETSTVLKEMGVFQEKTSLQEQQLQN
jgi:L-asparaginase